MSQSFMWCRLHPGEELVDCEALRRWLLYQHLPLELLQEERSVKVRIEKFTVAIPQYLIDSDSPLPNKTKSNDYLAPERHEIKVNNVMTVWQWRQFWTMQLQLLTRLFNQRLIDDLELQSLCNLMKTSRKPLCLIDSSSQIFKKKSFFYSAGALKH